MFRVAAILKLVESQRRETGSPSTIQIGKTGSPVALWPLFGVRLGAMKHPLDPQRKITAQDAPKA